QLRAQLAPLAAALATVTREKALMEASYRAERRQMKQELQQRLRELQELREPQQREGEPGPGELQELLRAERRARCRAEAELQEARQELQEARQELQELRQELQELRQELQAARDEAGKQDPRVQELQEEVAGLKNHFQLQLVHEMKKTAQAEEQLRLRAQRDEQRVAELEAQVAQVAELLGTYDAAKQRDQAAIQRLKERLAQLDLENKSLALAASSRPLGAIPTDESALDVPALKEKMERLRKLLQAAGQGVEEPEPFPEGAGDTASGGHCQPELRQLKEEFERSKVRAQQLLQSEGSKDAGLAEELQQAREQLAQLRDKHMQLQLAADEAQQQHREELQGKKQELQQLQQLHRQELERCQLQFRQRALQLEEEMHKQRDRALAVLAEKERELQRLRAPVLPHRGPQDTVPEAEPGCDSAEILPRELQPCPGSEPTFFLYAEQLARKEVEIAALRKQRHGLQLQLQQLQGRALAEQDRHREEVAVLQGEIQKSCRDKSREGANLEYLKNVVFRFLTLPDARGRQQTLAAIQAILHFSPEERLSIAQSSARSSWWPHGRR
ncbi:GCC1 protein, partial [Spelaeornis formosus]|nr:GCC1 protein [Elachura formosa]